MQRERNPFPKGWLVSAGVSAAVGATATFGYTNTDSLSYSEELASHNLTRQLVRDTISVDNNLTTAQSELVNIPKDCTILIPGTSVALCTMSEIANPDAALAALDRAEINLASIGDTESLAAIEDLEESVIEGDYFAKLNALSAMVDAYDEKAEFAQDTSYEAQDPDAKGLLALASACAAVMSVVMTGYSIDDIYKWRKNGGKFGIKLKHLIPGMA